MEDKKFLNKEVAELTGLTGRQVLSWTEKALVIPFKESPGVGKKRLYDRTNLLEFALSKILLDMGLGFRRTKNIIGDLRNKGAIKSWATDFSNYHKNYFEKSKADLHKAINKLKKEGHSVTYLEEADKNFKKPFKPEKPIGILIYYFGNEECTILIPWEIDYVLNLNMIKEGLTGNQGLILIDIGKIKKAVDRKL